MLKYAILIAVVVIGYIAYTGTDVTEEYDAITEIRDIVFGDVVDPLTKDILKQASESNIEEIIENSIEKYGEEKIEM